MENTLPIIKASGAVIGGACSYILGGFDQMLYALVVMVCLDVVTGVLSAGYHKELNSSIGYTGLIRKVGIFVMVAVAHLIDQYIAADILRGVTIGFYIAMEGISILENWGKMNLPLPPKIKEVLQQLHTEADKEKLKEEKQNG